MRRNREWTGPGLAVVALLLGLGTASSARANGMTSETTTSDPPPLSVMAYSTAGAVGTTGITGANVVSINTVAGGTVKTPSAFSLGEFVVSALQEGQKTTYERTPFSFTYLVSSINGATPDKNETPVEVRGELTGTVDGPDQSNLVATFDPVTIDPVFRTGDFLNTLKVGGSVLLVPSSNNGGRTTVQARISSSAVPAPEPTTIALFVVASVGLGLRHRMRSRVTS